jgi:hypothetical protein
MSAERDKTYIMDEIDGKRVIEMPPDETPPDGGKGWIGLHSLSGKGIGGVATDWFRFCEDYLGTTRLGAAGGAIAKVLHIRPAGKLED